MIDCFNNYSIRVNSRMRRRKSPSTTSTAAAEQPLGRLSELQKKEKVYQWRQQVLRHHNQVLQHHQGGHILRIQSWVLQYDTRQVSHHQAHHCRHTPKKTAPDEAGHGFGPSCLILRPWLPAHSQLSQPHRHGNHEYAHLKYENQQG